MATYTQSAYDDLISGYNEQIASLNDRIATLNAELASKEEEHDVQFGGVRPTDPDLAAVFDSQAVEITKIKAELSQAEEDLANATSSKEQLESDIANNVSTIIADPSNLLFQLGQKVKEEKDKAETFMNDVISSKENEALAQQDELNKSTTDSLNAKIAQLVEDQQRHIAEADANMDSKAKTTYINFFEEGNGSYADLAEKGLNVGVIQRLEKISGEVEADASGSFAAELYTRFTSLWSDYGTINDPKSDKAYSFIQAIQDLDSDISDTNSKATTGIDNLVLDLTSAYKTFQKLSDVRGMESLVDGGMTDKEYQEAYAAIEADGNTTSTEKLDKLAALTREYNDIDETGNSPAHSDTERREGIANTSFFAVNTVNVQKGWNKLNLEIRDIHSIEDKANAYSEELVNFEAECNVSLNAAVAELVEIETKKKEFEAKHAEEKAKRKEEIESFNDAVAVAQTAFDASSDIDDASTMAQSLLDAKASLMRSKLNYSTMMLQYYAQLTKFESDQAKVTEEQAEVQQALDLIGKAKYSLGKTASQIEGFKTDMTTRNTDSIVPIVTGMKNLTTSWVEETNPIIVDFHHRVSSLAHEITFVPSILREVDLLITDAVNNSGQ